MKITSDEGGMGSLENPTVCPHSTCPIMKEFLCFPSLFWIIMLRAWTYAKQEGELRRKPLSEERKSDHPFLFPHCNLTFAADPRWEKKKSQNFKSRSTIFLL